MAKKLMWISEYDLPNRRVTIVRASGAAVGHHWTPLRRDDVASDPQGRFDIFRASDTRDHSLGAVVKVSAALGDDGAFDAAHPDFDKYSIGSLTIWPGDKGAGPLPIQADIGRWVWWIEGDVFHRDPRPWADAHSG